MPKKPSISHRELLPPFSPPQRRCVVDASALCADRYSHRVSVPRGRAGLVVFGSILARAVVAPNHLARRSPGELTTRLFGHPTRGFRASDKFPVQLGMLPGRLVQVGAGL